MEKEKGFTLIELLVSAAIVSVLSAIAVLNFKEYRYAAVGAEMTSAARSMYSTILLLDSEESASGVVNISFQKNFNGEFAINDITGTVPSQAEITADFIKSVPEINADNEIYASINYTPLNNIYSILVAHCKAKDRIFYSKNSNGLSIPGHLSVEDNTFKVRRFTEIGINPGGFYSPCS